MSNFLSIENAIISASLEFVSVGENTLQQFTCKNGEIAGFKIVILSVLGFDYQISQVYDCSSGSPVQKGNVSVVPGIDLTGGLFSSGCFCNGDPTLSTTSFYKVDY